MAGVRRGRDQSVSQASEQGQPAHANGHRQDLQANDEAIQAFCNASAEG